jgi:hypothetical protein
MNEFNAILEMVKSGKRKETLPKLSSFIKKHPENKEAWWLMLSMVDGKAKKADCYRQILKLDPNDVIARAHFDALLEVDVDEERIEVSDETPDKSLPDRCPNCAGDLDIHFIGELKDKWAVCPYCQTKIDLPDAFRRVKRISEEHERKGKKTRVETTVIETRGDKQIDFENLPPEVQELLKDGTSDGSGKLRREILEKVTKGGIAIQKLENENTWLKKNGEFSSELLHELLSMKSPENATVKEFLAFLVEAERLSKEIPLEESQVHLLEALPADEQVNCPQCDAVISKFADKCEWCSEPLAPEQQKRDK